MVNGGEGTHEAGQASRPCVDEIVGERPCVPLNRPLVRGRKRRHAGHPRPRRHLRGASIALQPTDERRRHPPRRTPGQTECASAGTSFTASATMGGLWRQAGWITAELRNASTGAGRGEERGGRNQCPGESAPRLPLLLQLRTCSPAQCFLELFLLVRNSGLRRPCCVIPNVRYERQTPACRRLSARWRG